MDGWLVDRFLNGQIATKSHFFIVFYFRFSTSFDTSYRTICSTVFRDNNTNEQEVAMYIDVFTSSSEELEYDIEIEPVDNFNLT